MSVRLRRFAAGLGALFLPLLWLATLGADPEGQTANYFRVLGAIFGAGAGWILLAFRGAGPGWRTCLVAGVVGSLSVTAISVVAPAIGNFAASGWLVSGIVGGGMVALTLFAVRGSVDAPQPAAADPGEPRSDSPPPNEEPRGE